MGFQGGRPLVRLQSQLSGGHRAYSIAATTRRVPISPSITSALHDTDTPFKITNRVSNYYRSYADKPVSRPKAHTGRATASSRRSPTTSATKAAKKPATETNASKDIPGDGTEAKLKIKTRTKTKPKSGTKVKAKAKPKPKAKKKPKKKAKIVRPKKKILTEKQKTVRAVQAEKEKIRSLKETAILTGKPKGLPETAWTVFNSERSQSSAGPNAGVASIAKESSVHYRALEPEQLEHYNHIANQNKVANQAAYTTWIESMTPGQIHAANLARLKLNRKLSKEGPIKKRYKQLKDERQVRGRRSAWVEFYRSRFLTGDYNGMKVSVAIGLAAREWKGLSEAEKKPFLEAAVQDAARERADRKATYAD